MNIINKKLKKYTNKNWHKTDPPNQFPWVRIISKKMAQKRPTTLIRIQHLHNYCVIIIFFNIIILIYYYYTYYYYLLLSLLYGLLLSYYDYYYYFYTQLYRFCLHRHNSSRSKTAFACFFSRLCQAHATLLANAADSGRFHDDLLGICYIQFANWKP